MLTILKMFGCLIFVPIITAIALMIFFDLIKPYTYTIKVGDSRELQVKSI